MRRFLYTPTKFVDEELDDLMQKKGFIKLKDKYESIYLVAIPYKDGLVNTTKSCSLNLREGQNQIKVGIYSLGHLVQPHT